MTYSIIMRKFVFQFPILPEKSDFLPIQPTVDSGKMPKCKKKESTLTGTLFCWLGWKDLNPRNDGARTRCLTPWLHPNVFGKTGEGFSGAFRPSGWARWIRTIGMKESKSSALPLGYSPMLSGVDSGIRTHGLQSHNLTR